MERRPTDGRPGSATGSASDVGSTGRRRKSIPQEAAVALRCLRSTVLELEEAHEAMGALLRLRDSDGRQKDTELASLRAQLQAKGEAAQAAQAAEGGPAAEAARKLEELEAQYGGGKSRHGPHTPAATRRQHPTAALLRLQHLLRLIAPRFTSPPRPTSSHLVPPRPSSSHPGAVRR